MRRILVDGCVLLLALTGLGIGIAAFATRGESATNAGVAPRFKKLSTLACDGNECFFSHVAMPNVAIRKVFLRASFDANLTNATSLLGAVMLKENGRGVQTFMGSYLTMFYNAFSRNIEAYEEMTAGVGGTGSPSVQYQPLPFFFQDEPVPSTWLRDWSIEAEFSTAPSQLELIYEEIEMKDAEASKRRTITQVESMQEYIELSEPDSETILNLPSNVVEIWLQMAECLHTDFLCQYQENQHGVFVTAKVSDYEEMEMMQYCYQLPFALERNVGQNTPCVLSRGRWPRSKSQIEVRFIWTSPPDTDTQKGRYVTMHMISETSLLLGS